MKKLIIAILIGAGLMSCEQEHVGYLLSSEAAYPVDSLVVYNAVTLEQTITKMQDDMEHFQQTEEGKILYEKIAACQFKYDSLMAEAKELKKKRTELDDYIWENEDKLPAEEVERLYELYDSMGSMIQDLEGQARVPFDQIKLLEEEIEAAIGTISQDLADLQSLQKNHATYTTSPIDGIKGTEPLIYTIAEIKVIGEGDAGKFAPYLSVMGGGRIVISWDDKIPVGRYLISLYVENEGWKDLLEDKFTIIVK